VASDDSSDGQVGSLKWAVALYRFEGVLAACRLVTASSRHIRGNCQLVEPDECSQNSGQCISDNFHNYLSRWLNVRHRPISDFRYDSVDAVISLLGISI
jgi:hypothetical protein